VLELYEREKEWAPAHVDDHLRSTRLALRHEQEQADLLRGRLETADKSERERLARELAGREALAEALNRKAADLEVINEAGGSWYAAPAETREAAAAAQAELERRKTHEQMENAGRDEMRGTEERTEPGRWIVRFELYGMAMCEIEFRVASNLLYQPLTCKSDAAGAIRQYELIRFTSSVAGTRTASD
jgi:hypothetical protein